MTLGRVFFPRLSLLLPFTLFLTNFGWVSLQCFFSRSGPPVMFFFFFSLLLTASPYLFEKSISLFSLLFLMRFFISRRFSCSVFHLPIVYLLLRDLLRPKSLPAHDREHLVSAFPVGRSSSRVLSPSHPTKLLLIGLKQAGLAAVFFPRHRTFRARPSNVFNLLIDIF